MLQLIPLETIVMALITMALYYLEILNINAGLLAVWSIGITVYVMRHVAIPKNKRKLSQNPWIGVVVYVLFIVVVWLLTN